MCEVLIYQRISIYGSVWQNVANHSVGTCLRHVSKATNNKSTLYKNIKDIFPRYSVIVFGNPAP